MTKSKFVIVVVAALALAASAAARDAAPLANWGAPPYWTPPSAAQLDREPASRMDASAFGMEAQSLALPSAPLPFIAITPCRIVDTRVALSDGFHQPAFADAETRTFNFPASTGCPGLPATAGAYSINVNYRPLTVASFLTAFPTGTTMPLVATVVGYPTAFTGNAAIVPAGTSGQIDVYSQFAGNVIIDINGYYAAQPATVGTIFANTFSVATANRDPFLPVSGAGTPAGSEPANQFLMPGGCSATSFAVLEDVANGTGDITFTLRVNGADSALGCTILSAGTSCTAIGSVSLAAGTKVAIGTAGAAAYGATASLAVSLQCQ